MATGTPSPCVSVDEYLNSSYHPEMEYVDGVLVERNLPTFFHAVLQVILLRHFRTFEKDLRIKVLLKLRTQIIEGARYRVPDVLICQLPTRAKRVLQEVPLAVIEILSPDDRMSDILDRFRDYEGIGVAAIVQMDPERFVAHRFSGGSLIETKFQTLCALPHADQVVPFDSDALFAQLRTELQEAEQG